MAQLAVGVVGLGLGRMHVAHYSARPDVGRIVLCDPNAERVAELRARYPEKIGAAYATLEEMLAAERLDAVSVTTPDHLHRAHAIQCLEAGCHVLLAKPIATSLEDARAIIAAADRAPGLLMLAHERRYRASTLAVKRMLERGELGEVISLSIDSIQDKREQFRRAPWYAAPEAGRSAIVGSGIHQVDLVRYLVGQPVAGVVAYANRLGDMIFPKDKTTAALFRFGSGAIGQVTVCYEAHWPVSARVDGHAFRLIGTRGVVMGDRVATDDRDEWRSVPETDNPVQTGIIGCIEAFLQSIQEGTPVPITARDAYASLAACIAADDAARSGREVVPVPVDF